MKKLIILSALCLIIPQAIQAQDVYSKLGKKICKCLEKEKVATMEDAKYCMEKSLYDNLTALMEHHGVKSLEEIESADIGKRMTGELAKNCPYAVSLIHDSISESNPMFAPDSIVNCENLKIGEYYYITPNTEGKFVDTTYVTFSKNGYMERMNHGKTYSRLSLEWRNDCKFRVTFIESNDPLKNGLSKPGDKYDYEIIKETANSIVVKAFWNKEEYHVEFFKVGKT